MQLVDITIKLFHVVIPEIIAVVFLVKHGNRFKFRFSSVEGHGNLKPYAKTASVAIAMLFIAFFGVDIFELLIGKQLTVWLTSFGSKLIFLTLSLLGAIFLGFYNYLLEKKWDKVSWGVLAVAVICIIILFA